MALFDVVQSAGVEILAKGPRKRICTTRLILVHIQDKVYVVLTPRGEIVVESFDNPDVLYGERLLPDRAIPLALGKLNEDFDPMPSQDEFETLVAQAEAQADEVLASR